MMQLAKEGINFQEFPSGGCNVVVWKFSIVGISQSRCPDFFVERQCLCFELHNTLLVMMINIALRLKLLT